MKKYKNDLDLAKAYVRKAQSSKDRNIEFTLTFSQFKTILNRKTCFYTGKKFEIEPYHNANYPTLDRIDSTKGYAKGNVVACIHAINAVKNAAFESPDSLASINDVARMIDKLRKIGFL